MQLDENNKFDKEEQDQTVKIQDQDTGKISSGKTRETAFKISAPKIHEVSSIVDRESVSTYNDKTLN